MDGSQALLSLDIWNLTNTLYHKRDKGFAEGQVTARRKMLQWVVLFLQLGPILSPVFFYFK